MVSISAMDRKTGHRMAGYLLTALLGMLGGYLGTGQITNIACTVDTVRSN